MQKLKLLKNLKSSQFLSKDQLRSVTGGVGSCYCSAHGMAPLGVFANESTCASYCEGQPYIWVPLV